MQNASISRLSPVSMALMLMWGLFTVAAPATAQPHDARCSNRTLSGAYGGGFAGRILATNVDPERQVTGVSLIHYDGDGQMTSVEHVVFGGFAPAIEWTPATGTYTVNADCTGSSVTYSPNSPQGLVQHFVVVANGNEVRSVVDFGAFAAVSTKVSGGTDQSDKSCSNRTLSGDYGFSIVGDLIGPNGALIPLRTLSRQQFDGSGNMTGVDHAVVGGVPPTEEWREISGTYSVNPDCTGKGQVIFGPGASLDVYLVVVNKGREIHEVVNGGAVTTVGIRVQ
jgi:hypothetical protein